MESSWAHYAVLFFFNYLTLTIKFTAEIPDTEVTYLDTTLKRELILGMFMNFKPTESCNQKRLP